MIRHFLERTSALASAGFKFWLDGSTCAEVVESDLPDILFPFVVRVSGKHYIPINAIVFATNEEHAKGRVIEHLEYVRDNARRTDAARYHGDVDPTREHKHALELLADLASGKLNIQSAPFPTHQISKVQWACNDGFIT